MDTRHWQRVSEVFQAVSGLSGPVLKEALDRHCGDDDPLKREVISLLVADRDAGSWLAGLSARAGVPPMSEPEDLFDLRGREIGAWRLLELIGRGGMGVVYLAERADHAFRQRVALKMLPVGLATPGAVYRFRRERDILATLEHPGIARLIDGGVTPEGTPYYVMEHVDGVTLDRYCERENPTLEQRLALFRKVASSVAFAHRHLVVHRDIKPANVMVTADGEPRLLDFGIARLLETEQADAEAVTRMAGRRLTPGYAAPELLEGGAPATAGDVYSLGIVLYELLSRRRAFPEGFFDRSDWTDRMLSYRPPPPSATAGHPRDRRALRGDLDRIVAMAMHADPGRRYPTVDALLDDLDRYQQHRPIQARKDSTGYRAARFVRRHAVGVALSSLAVISLAGGLGASSYYAVEAARRAAETDRARERAEAVSGFLEGLFRAADPWRGDLDPEDRLRDMLQRADPLSSIESSHPPLTRARLLMSYATAVRMLGDYDKAEEAGRTALSLVQSADATTGLRAGARVDLATTLTTAGELEEAESLLDEARKEAPLDETAGPSAFHARIALLQLYAEDRRGPEEGLDLVARLAPYTDRMRALDPGLWIDFEQARLQTLLNAGRFERTLSRAREVADWVRRNRGGEHPSLADTLSYVAGALHELGRAPEAEKIDRETLAIYKQSLGAGHPWTVAAHNQLATSLSTQGAYETALDHYRRAKDGWQGIHGEQHPYVSRALVNIAQSQRKLGRTGKAVATMAGAYRMETDMLGTDHPQTALTRVLYGRLLGESGEFGKAETHFEEGLATLAGAWGGDHPVVLRLRAEYARFLIRKNRPGPAVALLDAILPGLRAAYGDAGIYPGLATAYRGLAEARLSGGKAAIEDLRAARRMLGADEWKTRRHARLLDEIDRVLQMLANR